MWLKDIRNYNVKILDGDNIIYSGNVDNAPEELKEKETKSVKLEQKILIIEI